MKRNKIEELKKVATEQQAEFVHNLHTGKYFRNGVEMSEKQWNQIQDKNVKIDLGEGTPPEPDFCKN